MKGFTLIEILITMAILVILAVFGSVNLLNYYSRQGLRVSVNNIIMMLQEARTDSQQGADGNGDGQSDQWGIRLENITSSAVKIFYNTTSTVNRVYNLEAGVQFIDPSAGQAKEIIFSKITGYPNTTTSVIVALKNNPTASSTISVDALGRVTQIGL